MISGPCDALKTCAGKLGNATAAAGTDRFIDAVKMQCALLTTMATFRKPKDIAFCTTGSKIVEWQQQTEAEGRKDRKSPLDIMKVLTDSL